MTPRLSLGHAGSHTRNYLFSPLPLRRPHIKTTSTRHASSSVPRRFISTTLLLGTSVALVAYYYDSRSLMHEHVMMPLARLIDPETGHKLAIRLLSLPKWARPRDMGVDGKELEAEIFGIPLKNPIGIAAGFDKDAEAIDGLFDLGFGYVEVGSITPEPQPGNPKPRFFRLTEDSAAVNRYGFNSLGHGQALFNLRSRLISFAQSHPSYFPSPLPSNLLPPSGLPRSLRPGHILAVNLGKNKTSAADSNEDYVRGVRTLGPYADVVVINVSSPNTPGLRALQGREILKRLLDDVVVERNKIMVDGLPKIAVKVACDLNEDELADVASAVRSSGVDGVIVSNTTVRREGLGLNSSNASEIGGLSGPPLLPYALRAVRILRPLLPPSIPIIGCGGISTASDALSFAHAGCSIIQIYTSFGYRGVGTARLIKDELSSLLLTSTSSISSSSSTSRPFDLARNDRSKSIKGNSWKSQINKDIPPEKFQQQADQLKKEAEELSKLLESLHQRESLEKLVRETEVALGKVSRHSDSSVDTENKEGDGSEKEEVLEVSEKRNELKLLGNENVRSESLRDRLIDGTIRRIDQVISNVNMTETSEQAVLSVTPSSEEKQDEWTQAVRSGQRRLV